MIRISKLTKHDLEIYQGKNVLLYGLRGEALFIYKIFRKLGIDVVGYSSVSQPTPLQFCINMWKRIKYISPSDVSEVVKQYDNIILQGLEFDPVKIERTKKKAEKWGVLCSNIDAGQIRTSFEYLVTKDLFENTLRYWCGTFYRKLIGMRQVDRYIEWRKFQKKDVENPILICSPQKTADLTLINTFDYLNNSKKYPKINYAMLIHKPTLINKSRCEKKWSNLKIIVGMREPILQNLSGLYQRFSSGIAYSWMAYDIEGKSKAERLIILDQYKTLFEDNGDNVQMMWEHFVNMYVNFDKDISKLTNDNCFIQLFFPIFQLNVLDVLAYPFDKEKGYTIIKDGNTEIFMYQLEKLNQLVPELSEWVGVPFDKLENGNKAEDKWLGESYKQAQKEIQITQEYFDKCFDEPYVKHCYSEADIEKFKEKWRPHIKHEH